MGSSWRGNREAVKVLLRLNLFLTLKESHFLLRLFASDFAATVFVWLWGVIFTNSSVYDPYWSVAPPLMLTACFRHSGTQVQKDP